MGKSLYSPIFATPKAEGVFIPEFTERTVLEGTYSFLEHAVYRFYKNLQS
jgi:hypothetical protein